ncbi:MAG: hypothetical protein H0T97_09870 [Actinobacteria bacterium]|nr:hypothetical protein [Actinomycetota bacterium]
MRIDPEHERVIENDIAGQAQGANPRLVESSRRDRLAREERLHDFQPWRQHAPGPKTMRGPDFIHVWPSLRGRDRTAHARPTIRSAAIACEQSRLLLGHGHHSPRPVTWMW